jgi:hypothetical protein
LKILGSNENTSNQISMKNDEIKSNPISSYATDEELDKTKQNSNKISVREKLFF